MAIVSGTKFGSYEVAAQIGAGGMGEVYKAHDSKLGRDVAIKVLPEAFADDPERLSRFQREAKMLAALNHPNIATIFGLEHSNGTHYLVMELVPGDTLQQRIKRDGAVPIEEALAIAKQIAEALEAAHEKGIIHRDLKPANVKLTPEGKVKVLDFGLAKAFEGDPSSVDIGNSPTLSQAATMQGVILGTAAYMSPEQARGRAVDKRTDIWAFGCVLYELLTGKQAFHGEDLTEILAAVVKSEPDWTALPANISPSIRVLLQRCLRKDRRQRTPDAATNRIEIEDALAAPAAVEPAAAAMGGVLGRRTILWGAGCLVAACVFTGLTVWNLKPTPSKPVTRTVITLPADQRLAADENPAVVISPDGRLLAYAAIQGGVQQLYLRAMESLEAKTIPGTEGAVNPFFSPDGQSLGFFAGDKLKKVSVNGGGVTTLGDAATPRGASWGDQGSIVFAPSVGGPLQQIPEGGGAAKPLTELAKGETSHRWPEVLPDGKAVLFGSGQNNTSMQVEVHVTATGEQRILVPALGPTQPRYAASGHLLYVQGGTLMAAPFDAGRQAVNGEAVPVVENVQGSSFGAVQYSISATGLLVYVSGGSQVNQNRLVLVSRDGKEQPLAAPPGAYSFPHISPDGRKVVVGRDNQVWVYELARDTMTRFTFEGTANNAPVWAPDGNRIAFSSNMDGPLSVYWQKADGSGGTEKLTGSEYLRGPVSWSGDGQLLSFVEVNSTTGYDIWVLDMKDPSQGSGQGRKAVPFLQTPFNELGAISPDGHWMAYYSNESGRYEVYVQPYPGPGGKWQISTDGGMDMRWSVNGRELIYRNGDKMMAVDITTQPAFLAGKPKVLFEGPYVPPSPNNSYYDVSADGQRFLMLKPTEQAQAATQIVVVQNFFEELKQKVPTGKK